MAQPPLKARGLAPYFVFAALIHIVSVASRFDTLAAKLPAVVAPALMMVQFPLLMLSGYFESRIDYGETIKDFPLWMRIKSKPVKIAMTFAFIYIALIPLQHWDISIGPLDPTPPKTFPEPQRAMWFGIFTAGMFFPFYLAATSLLIPVLRAITWPFRKLPSAILAAILALVVGAGLGVLIFAVSESKAIGDMIAFLRDAYRAQPMLGLAVTLTLTFGPLLIGLFRGEKDE